MKKLLFSLIALSFSSFAFSQARSLRVENQTSCTQYYIIVGDEWCKCGDKYYSPLIAIPPGGSHGYTTTMPLGGSFPAAVPKSISGAKIPDGPPGCMLPGSNVSEPCFGMPLSYTYMSYKDNCEKCAKTTATWVPAPDCDGQAKLIFTP